MIFVIVLLAYILGGCEKEKPKQGLIEQPLEQSQQAPKQLSNPEYIATASNLIDKNLEIIEDFSNATYLYNNKLISKSELDKSLQCNQDKMQMLIELVSDLDKQSQSIYYPGEGIHLTTYLLNATREAKMSMKYLEANDWENSKSMLSESKNDLMKFMQGYSSLE